jgi:hypothetical protein
MSSLAWSPFTSVVELPPNASVLSYKSYPTHAYDPGGEYKHDEWHNHSVAVLWDEDRDTRVLDALAYLVYAAPRTASRVSAIAERKGSLTVWAASIGADDWLAFGKASQTTQVLDNWPVEVRELILPAYSDKFDIPTKVLVQDNGRDERGTPRLVNFQDELVLHINALYRLGWWGQPKPPRIAAPEIG